MAHATIENDKIKIDTTYREKPLIEPLPGSSFRQSTWWMPLSWGSCQALRGAFGKKLEIGPDLLEWSRAEYTHRVRDALALRDQVEPQHGDLPVLNPDLRPYQAIGVTWMLAAKSGILGDEMGIGKTVQTLEFIRVMDEKPTLPALMIVPNSVKYHWARLAARWCPNATPYVIEGSAVKRRKILAEASVDPAAMVIVSLEATRSMSRLAPFGSIKLRKCLECDPKRGDEIKPAQCEVHPKELNAITFRTVVLDEIHRIKDAKSKQTRSAWQLMHAPGVNYRWGLTGTVIATDPGDLWSPLHAVAPEDWPQKTRYIDRYCLTDWNVFGGLDIVGLRPDTRDEFFRIFEPRFRRMLKSVVLPFLPEVTREIRTCDLTPAMRRTYDDLYGSLATRLPDGTLMIAWNDMTKQGKLAQLASSAVEIDKKDPDDILTWKVELKNPSPKIDALVDLLRDLGFDGKIDRSDMAPVVVAAESRRLINLAAERLDDLNFRTGIITGDVDPYERENALDALRRREIDVLLFTIKAGGAGLDMSASDTLIFIQQPWSMIERLQTEGRVHRIGSEIHDSVKIIDIITRDTVEDQQINRVHVKLEKLEEITRDREARAAADLGTDDLDFAEAEIVKSAALDPDWPGDDGDDAPNEVVAGYLHDLHKDPIEDPSTAAELGEVVHVLQPGDHNSVPISPSYPVSASKLNDWTRCRRKWWLTWCRNLTLEEDQTGLRATGTRIHKALAGWYVPEAAGPVDPRDGLEAAISADWARLLERTGVDEEHESYQAIKDNWLSTTALERAMIDGYMEWIEETGADEGLTFVASETELSADIETTDHDGRPLTVHAMGKLDARAVRDVDGARNFVDHKTTGNFGRTMHMIQMDPQMLMYHLLEWLNTEEGEARCDGALWNMLRRVKRTASAKPPFYAREPVHVNRIQLESFKRNLIGAARDMVQAERQLQAGGDPMEIVYPTKGEDCSWKCDFFPVCPLFNDGSRPEDMISGVYTQGDPWSRYDRMNKEGDTDGDHGAG
jgi:superfamily II DNA or RNA helicase